MVKQLERSQIEIASEVLARAFQNEPIHSVIFADPEKRKKKMPAYFKFLIKYTMKKGKVLVTSPKIEAVALVLPSKNAHVTFWNSLTCGAFTLIRKMGLKVMDRLMLHDYVFNKIHKKVMTTPHLYLMTMGVEPEYDGKGFGKQLFYHIIEHENPDKLPIYFDTNGETTMLKGVGHGIEILDKTTIPGTNVENWAMVLKLKEN
ncbi:MAG: hypothetical protein ACFFCS_15110 [Candidatus Hodarchaeota archaeon]